MTVLLEKLFLNLLIEKPKTEMLATFVAAVNVRRGGLWWA